MKTFLLIITILSYSSIAQQPTLNWLGTLGGNFSHAYGVSADGLVVVGVSNTSNYEERAFRWTLANGMENLGTFGGNQSVAKSISADGSVIVGWARDVNDIKRAFIWTAATGMQDLGTGDFSEAVGVSADGSNIIINKDDLAYRWTALGGMDNLGTLGGNYTTAYDISADGSVIVGSSYVNASDPYAFRWVSGSVIQQIGTFYSIARGVSADGNTVTGSETGALGFSRAFRWTQSSGFEYGIAGNFSYGLAVSEDGSIIVGDGGDGAFRLSNAGGLEYLQQVYSNLINVGSELIDAVDISPNGLFIVGKGVNSLTGLDEGYLIAVNGVSSINESGNNPENFLLSQNYPNPFNPITTIKYTIPTPPSSSPLAKGRNEVGFVTLKVYDVLGNEVVTLVNEEKAPGTYEVEFQSTVGNGQLASGIYYYQLRSGDYLETKKMLMIK